MASYQQIHPRYKLILLYNIRDGKQGEYYRFMIKKFVPNVRDMDVYLQMVWYVAYGGYPIRKIEFVAESAETLRRLFYNENWSKLEHELQRYVDDYERKVVEYRNGFQL